MITESLLSNVNEEGFDIGWIEEAIDHRKRDSALSTSDGFITIGTTTKSVIMTKRWDIQVKWKDGSVDWMLLSQVKEAIPVQRTSFQLVGN